MTRDERITKVVVPLVCAIAGLIGGIAGCTLHISRENSKISNKINNVLNIDGDNVSVNLQTSTSNLIEAYETAKQELVKKEDEVGSLQSDYQQTEDQVASLQDENRRLSDENKKIKDYLLKDNVYIDNIDDLVVIKQTTDRLSDLYLIGSERYDVVQAVRDLYGDIHSVSYKFHPYSTAYAEYRLDGKYDIFEANIATNQETGSDVHISIEVYIDGDIIKRVDDVTRDTTLVPLGPISVRNGSKLKIKVLTIEGDAYRGGYCYITDDCLSVV